nr:uncharacterized protein LOC122273483 [Parasteatoda tepidariorum]
MVYRESVSSSKRIVFDASSHEEGELSLNDCLYAGLSLNPLIFYMLIFFRLNAAVILADIEKAFLQISLNETDRNAVRFLFPSSNPAISEQYDINIFRFCRVLFGVNASSFLLSATIKEHIKKYQELHPATTNMLNECLYVDDFIGALDDVKSAFQMSDEAKKIMAEASMNLCKWSSNSKELVQLWKDCGFETHPIHSEANLTANLHKVLGLPWHVHEDYISVDLKDLLKFDGKESITKRIVLRSIGKLFDILGFLSPYTIRLKCLLQDLWLRKCPWDTELPPDIRQQFIQWRSELSVISKLQVPRMILDSSLDDAKVLQIHVFSDASQRA